MLWKFREVWRMLRHPWAWNIPQLRELSGNTANRLQKTESLKRGRLQFKILLKSQGQKVQLTMKMLRDMRLTPLYFTPSLPTFQEFFGLIAIWDIEREWWCSIFLKKYDFWQTYFPSKEAWSSQWLISGNTPPILSWWFALILSVLFSWWFWRIPFPLEF